MLFTAYTGTSQVITTKKEAVKKGVYQKPSPSQKSDAVADRAPSSDKKIRTATKANPKNKKQLINDKDDNDVVPSSENYVAMQMINNAMTFIGVRYSGGGTTKAGMDCSGMVTAVFNLFDMKLPRSSTEMSKVGKKLAPDEIQKGDLVFFKTNGRSIINHVGMVVEVIGDEIKFVHSSTQKGVIVSSTKEPYYSKTFAQANRVL
jgi:cell wall-associated NlpC family hydrolase